MDCSSPLKPSDHVPTIPSAGLEHIEDIDNIMQQKQFDPQLDNQTCCSKTCGKTRFVPVEPGTNVSTSPDAMFKCGNLCLRPAVGEEDVFDGNRRLRPLAAHHEPLEAGLKIRALHPGVRYKGPTLRFKAFYATVTGTLQGR